MSEKYTDGTYYKGFALQVEVTVPELPYPYREEDSAADRLAYQAAHPGGELEMMQVIVNQEAIIGGNKEAEEVIREYNNSVCQYWDNGGEKNTYGYKLPPPLGDIGYCYKPATVAAPGLTTPAWSLPEGTTLYTIPNPLLTQATPVVNPPDVHTGRR